MIRAIFHSGGTLLDIGAIAATTGAAWLIIWTSYCPEGVHSLSGTLLTRIRRLLLFCLTALTVSSADSLVQRAMEMSGTGLAASLPLLSTVLFKTHYGSMWLVRIAGLLTAWTVVFAARRHTGSRLFGLLLFCAVSVIAFTRSASGHPADYGDLSSQQLADWLHLLAISSLGGILLAIAATANITFSSGDAASGGVISCIAHRFYAWFGPVLAVAVLTGVYNAWFQVGSFGALATSAYGVLLSIKLLLVVLLALRYIAPPEQGRDAALFLPRFLGRARTDAVIILLVLLFVSVLVHKIPAKHQAHIALLRQAAAQERAAEYASPHAGPVVTLDTRPAQVVAGLPVDMTVRIQDKDGKPLKDLVIMHERILHAIIVGQDLDFFAHIHSEDLGPITEDMVKKAALPLRFTFPKPGRYVIGIDFAAGEEAYSKTIIMDVSAPRAMEGPVPVVSDKGSFDGYDVTLKFSPEKVIAGVDTTLRYHIEKGGNAVKDLQPYLGAAMHLAVVSADLKTFIHAHGMVAGGSHMHHDHLHAPPPPERFGPDIDADITFPEKGIYKVFSQVSHNGRVLLFSFVVKVE